MRLGDGEPDGAGDALPERARRDLDSGRGVRLGVSGRVAAEGAEGGEVLEAHRVAEQMQHNVLQRARVSVGEDEAVAAGLCGWAAAGGAVPSAGSLGSRGGSA